MNTEFDIAIIGAGPVGAMLALQLSQRGNDAGRADHSATRICLIDARSASAAKDFNDSDRIHPLERTLALSAHSFSALCALQVPLPGCAPITQIHVSQQGQFGRTLLCASELSQPALGYTLLYSQLVTAFDQALLSAAGDVARPSLQLQFDSKVESITQHNDHATVSLTDGHTIAAKLLVIADGGSSLALLSGLAIDSQDYGKSAVLAQLSVSRPLNGLAYERFTEVGPLALLPVQVDAQHEAQLAAMVWVTTPEHAQLLTTQPESEFVAAFQSAFGARAGRFTGVRLRKSYPLRYRTVQPRYGRRFVVIGNAAQTLHPVAGQGLNLGLRDAAELAMQLNEALAKGDDCGAPELLARYDRSREPDTRGTAGFTRLLTDIFERDEAIVRAGRGLALTALDLLPFARKALLSRLLYGVR